MAARDRLYWDAFYRDRIRVSETGLYPAPDPLLFMYTPPIHANGSDPDHAANPVVPTPQALDLASGVGQNGLWLASQGYSVDLMDISRVALTRAQDEASARKLRSVNFLQVDLDDALLQPAGYHLVCVCRYLNRALFPQLRAVVKPGGRIIYETFNVCYLDDDPTFERDQLVELGELASCFADWQVLRHSENGYISQVVAIKP